VVKRKKLATTYISRLSSGAVLFFFFYGCVRLYSRVKIFLFCFHSIIAREHLVGRLHKSLIVLDNTMYICVICSQVHVNLFMCLNYVLSIMYVSLHFS
jgi:hypothetical protein